MRIIFEEVGVSQVEHELMGVVDRAEAPEPVFHLIADQMRGDERELFATSGASSGNPWAELKQSTLMSKAAKGYPSAILIATSDLEASLTEPGGSNVEHISHDELVFGSSDPKGHFHLTGTRHMDKRDPLDFSRLRLQEWTREIQRYIVGADRATFGPGAP